jgi:PTH2 family peptidyl-tRNA hydrolase
MDKKHAAGLDSTSQDDKTIDQHVIDVGPGITVSASAPCSGVGLPPAEPPQSEPNTLPAGFALNNMGAPPSVTVAQLLAGIAKVDLTGVSPSIDNESTYDRGADGVPTSIQFYTVDQSDRPAMPESKEAVTTQTPFSGSPSSHRPATIEALEPTELRSTSGQTQTAAAATAPAARGCEEASTSDLTPAKAPSASTSAAASASASASASAAAASTVGVESDRNLLVEAVASGRVLSVGDMLMIWGGSTDFQRKMYIVVNKSLKMDKGKACTQVGHAVAIWTRRLERAPAKNRDYIEWLNHGEPKIVLKADLATILSIRRAYSADTEIVIDAGKTQVEPGSITAIAFAPMLEDQRPDILKKLKLL